MLNHSIISADGTRCGAKLCLLASSPELFKTNSIKSPPNTSLLRHPMVPHGVWVPKFLLFQVSKPSFDYRRVSGGFWLMDIHKCLLKLSTFKM